MTPEEMREAAAKWHDDQLAGYAVTPQSIRENAEIALHRRSAFFIRTIPIPKAEPPLFEFVLRVLSIFDGFDGPSNEQVWWRTDEEYAPITLFVNCNDTFFWGCSDCETITPENVAVLEQAVADAQAADKHGASHATELFCARVRNMRPQGACYKYYPRTMWPLFDACGEPRKTGLGNPLTPEEAMARK